MAKKNKKQYTAEQKYQYHKQRMNDKSVSENKRIYSRAWVTGFCDPYAKENLSPTIAEYERNKKYMDRGSKAHWQGDINGTKAATTDWQASHKACLEREKRFTSKK
ncbi:MAG: hypothetical protein LUD19_01130 [Clostridia bacterium]|nr:hypothetical protein [Clostridia bacterium]